MISDKSISKMEKEIERIGRKKINQMSPEEYVAAVDAWSTMKVNGGSHTILNKIVYYVFGSALITLFLAILAWALKWLLTTLGVI
jgi:hypothetical protein